MLESFTGSGNSTDHRFSDQDHVAENSASSINASDSFTSDELATFSYSGSSSYTFNGTGNSGGSYYEAGSYAAGSYSLSCVRYEGQGSETFTAATTLTRSEHGQSALTESGQTTGVETHGFGVFNSTLNSNYSSFETATFAETFQYSDSASGLATHSYYERGEYDDHEYDLSCVLYQGGGQTSFTQSESLTRAVQGGGHSVEHWFSAGAMVEEESDGGHDAANSYTGDGLRTFSFSGGSAYTLSRSGAASAASHEAGSFADGIYSFTSAIYTGDSHETYVQGQSGTLTESGTTDLTRHGQSDSVHSYGFGVFDDTAHSSFTSHETSAYSETFGFQDTSRGHVTFSSYESGSQLNGEYNFDSVVHQATSQSSFTEHESRSQSYVGGGTSHDHGFSDAGEVDSDSSGSIDRSGSFTSDELASFTFSGAATFTFDRSGSGSDLSFKSGTLAAGFYSFGSVSFQGQGNESFSQDYDELRSDARSVGLTEHGYAQSTITSDYGELDEASNFSYTIYETFTSHESYSAHDHEQGSSSFSYFEAGSFASQAYDLASVTHQGSSQSSFSSQVQAGDTYSGGGNSREQGFNDSGALNNGGGGQDSAECFTSDELKTFSFSGTFNSTSNAYGNETSAFFRAGSFSLGCYSFQSVVQQGQASGTFSEGTSGSELQTGTQDLTVSGEYESTHTYGFGIHDDYSHTSYSSHETSNYDETVLYSNARSGISTASYYEAGTLVGRALDLSSVVYQGSSQSSFTADELRISNFGGGGGNSQEHQLIDNGFAGSNAEGGFDGAEVSTVDELKTFSYHGGSVYRLDVSGNETSSYFQAGAYSGGSFNLATTVAQGGGNSCLSEDVIDGAYYETGSADSTKTGEFDSNHSYGFGIYDDTSHTSYTSHETSSYSETFAYNSSHEGVETYSFYEAGSYADGAEDLDCVVYQGTSLHTYLEYEAQIRQFTGGGVLHEVESGDTGDIQSNGGGGHDASESFTSDRVETFTYSGSESYTLAVAAVGSESYYEAGEFSGGEVSLSSVRYQGSLADGYFYNYGHSEVKQASGVAHIEGGAHGVDTFGFGTFDDTADSSFSTTETYTSTETFSETLHLQGSSTATHFEAGVFTDEEGYDLDCVLYQGSGCSTFDEQIDQSYYSTGTSVQSFTEELTSHGAQNEGAGSFDRLRVEHRTGLETGSFTRSTSDNRSEEGSETYGYYEAGVYSHASFNLSSVAYSGHAASSLTWEYETHDADDGTGWTNSVGSATSHETTGFGSFDHHSTGTFSGFESYSFSRSEDHLATHHTDQDDQYYEAGTWSDGAYSLSSVRYWGDGTTDSTQQDESTDSRNGTGTSSFSETTSGHSAFSDAASSFDRTRSGGGSGLESYGFDRFSTDSLTVSGTQTYGYVEAGTFAEGEYSLTSVYYDGGSSATILQDSGAAETFDASGWSYSFSNESGTDSRSYGIYSGSMSLDSKTRDTFTLHRYSEVSGHEEDVQQASYREAGSFLDELYNLPSVVYQGGSQRELTEHAEEQLERTGLRIVNGSSYQYETGTNSDGYSSFFEEKEIDRWSNRNDEYDSSSSAVDDSSGTSSSTYYEAGSFVNGSYSLSSALYQGASNESATFNSIGTEFYTGFEGVGRDGEEQATETFGYGDNDHSSFTSYSHYEGFDLHETVTHSTTRHTDQADAYYEAGTWFNGAYSLPCTVYSGSRHEHSADHATDSLTKDGSGWADVLDGETNGSRGDNGADQFEREVVRESTRLESFSYGGWLNVADHDDSRATATYYEAGAYAGGSYALSSVRYQGSDSSSGSFTEESGDWNTGTGSYDCWGYESSCETLNYGGETKENHATHTSEDDYDLLRSNTSSLQGPRASSHAYYEAGSYAGGAYSLASILYSGTESDSDWGSASSFECMSGDGLGALDSSALVSSSSSEPADSFTSLESSSSSGGSAYSFTYLRTSYSNPSSNRSSSYYEAGTYGLGKYNLPCVVYSGSSGWSDYATSYDTETYSGSESVSSSGESESFHTLDAGVREEWSAESFSSSDSHAYERSLNGTEFEQGSGNDYFYEAGSFAGGSYSLSSVSYSGSSHECYTLHSETSEFQEGASSSDEDFDSTTSASQDDGSTSFTEWSGTTRDTASQRSYARWLETESDATGAHTATYSEGGSWSAGEYSFSEIIYQGTGRAESTDLASGTEAYSDSGHEESSESNTYESQSSSGVGDSSSHSYQRDSSETFASEGTFAWERTDDAESSHSYYEAGDYLGGDYSLPSVLYQGAASQSWTYHEEDESNALASLTRLFADQYGSAGVGNTSAGGSTDDSTREDERWRLTTRDESGQRTNSYYQRGAFDEGQFSLPCVVYQGTESWQSEYSEDATSEESGSFTNSSSFIGTELSGTTVLGTYVSSGGAGGSFTAESESSFSASQWLDESYYEAGCYVSSEYHLSSVVYQESGGDSYASSEQSEESRPGSGSGSQSRSGVGGSYAYSTSYDSDDGSTHERTDAGLSSYTSYEAGTFSGGHYSLSSAVYDRHEEQSYTSDDVQGSSNIGGDSNYSYTYTNSQGSLETGHSSVDVHHEGSFANDAYSLSCYVRDEETVRDWETGSSGSDLYTNTYGTSNGQAHTQTDTGWDYRTGHEAGVYSGGSFALSSFLFDKQTGSNGSYTGWGSNNHTSSGSAWTEHGQNASSDVLYQAGTYSGGEVSLGTHQHSLAESSTNDSHHSGWSSGSGAYHSYTDHHTWTSNSAHDEAGTYAGGVFALTSFNLQQDTTNDYEYEDSGWDVNWSYYQNNSWSSDVGQYHAWLTGGGCCYTSDSSGGSGYTFYGQPWDGDPVYDSGSSNSSYHDAGNFEPSSSASPPSPVLELPWFHGTLRTYINAVDGFFAGYGGPHAIGRGPHATAPADRHLHGTREQTATIISSSPNSSSAPSSGLGSTPGTGNNNNSPQGPSGGIAPLGPEPLGPDPVPGGSATDPLGRDGPQGSSPRENGNSPTDDNDPNANRRANFGRNPAAGQCSCTCDDTGSNSSVTHHTGSTGCNTYDAGGGQSTSRGGGGRGNGALADDLVDSLDKRFGVRDRGMRPEPTILAQASPRGGESAANAEGRVVGQAVEEHFEASEGARRQQKVPNKNGTNGVVDVAKGGSRRTQAEVGRGTVSGLKAKNGQANSRLDRTNVILVEPTPNIPVEGDKYEVVELTQEQAAKLDADAAKNKWDSARIMAEAKKVGTTHTVTVGKAAAQQGAKTRAEMADGTRGPDGRRIKGGGGRGRTGGKGLGAGLFIAGVILDLLMGDDLHAAIENNADPFGAGSLGDSDLYQNDPFAPPTRPPLGIECYDDSPPAETAYPWNPHAKRPRPRPDPRLGSRMDGDHY